MRMTGASGEDAPTSSASGAVDEARASVPSSVTVRIPIVTYIARTIASAPTIARGRVRRGSRTSSPSVAMRAYPAKLKKSNPADCRIP